MSSLLTEEFILKISQQFAIFSSLFLLFIGSIGNIFNILVFYYLKLFRHNQCAFFLKIESFTNIIFLIIVLPLRIINNAFGYDPTQISLFCKVRRAVIQSFSFIPFLLICFASIDQYLSTNSRSYLRRLSTLKLAHHLTCFAIFIWVLHAILSLTFIEIRSTAHCAVYNVLFQQYLLFVQLFLINGFVPLFISSTFVILAYLNVRRIIRHEVSVTQRRLDRQLTAMVLTKVVFSVVTTLPFVINRIYILNLYIKSTDSLQIAIEKLIFTITLSLFYMNSAVSNNIYFAVIICFHFRVHFMYFYWFQNDFVNKSNDYL